MRPAVKKIAMTTPLSDNRFLPQDTGFKHWSCFCPPRTPAKKLAMVPSLQPAFPKMPMAPTFLSSSNTRRHNNARPHPLHTLLSAAAERSSYGYRIPMRIRIIDTFITPPCAQVCSFGLQKSSQQQPKKLNFVCFWVDRPGTYLGSFQIGFWRI